MRLVVNERRQKELGHNNNVSYMLPLVEKEKHHQGPMSMLDFERTRQPLVRR